MRCGPRAACSTVCRSAEPLARRPLLPRTCRWPQFVQSSLSSSRTARADGQHRAPNRGCRHRRRACLCRQSSTRRTISRSPHHLRLRLLEQYRWLRHQPDADRLFLKHLDLRPRLLGRTSQHASGRERSASCLRPCSALPSASRGCRAIGWSRISRAAMSNSSATCRSCCNFCSGTTRCSKRCRNCDGSVALPGGGLLNNRGLFLPRPEFAASFRYGLIALAGRQSRPRSFCACGRAAAETEPASRYPFFWLALGLVLRHPARLRVADGYRRSRFELSASRPV